MPLDQVSLFPFPAAASATGTLQAALDSRVLRVAALGPYDWAQDGDYLCGGVNGTAGDPTSACSEPTGFWPDYLVAVTAELQVRPLLPPPLLSFLVPATATCCRPTDS